MSRGWIDLFGRALCIGIFLLGTAPAAFADCTGEDLLERLVIEDPALHADIYREAATHPNHEGLLWRIDSPGVEPSFLFGTMHVSDHGTPELVKTVKSKITNARLLMTEIGMMDSERWAFEISNRMRKAKPSNLRTDLGPKAFEALKSELKFRNIPTGGIDTLPPWIAIELIWGARCEFEKAYKTGAQPTMDWDLMLFAKAQGIPERGIEGLNKSLNLFASADYAVQLELLRNVLEEFETEKDWITTGRAAQSRRETMVTEILARRLYPRPDDATPAERAAYDFWWDKIIVERNHFFVRRTKSELRRGGVVIAVGAMHLPTDDGMIELLRAEGFTVTRID